MNIPNYLSVFRLFIGPIFLLVYLRHTDFGIHLQLLPYVLLLLFAISEISDACDGWIARKYDQVTDFGKILDPMTDSIYRLSIFLTFTLPPVNIPMILIFPIFYRDSCINTLRTLCALKGFALAARPSGKLKAVIQAAAILAVICLFLFFSQGVITLETLQFGSACAVAFASLYSFLSALDYLYANRSYLGRWLAHE